MSENSPIDQLFAQKLLPQGSAEEAFLLLAHLLKMAREGHLCLPLTEELDPRILAGVDLLPPSLFTKHLVKEKNRLYLRRNWECENRFLTHLRRITSQKPAVSLAVDTLEMPELNSEQQQAVSKAAAQTLTLISGGPGTGKTYTASVIVRLFLEKGIKEIVVAAPTGKAAANMRRSLSSFTSQVTIQTLHALLTKDKLSADLILVDEAAMVDAELMATLFSAVKEGARLLLLGDKDQLPPVESGHFFADLAQDETLVCELQACLRSDLQEIIQQATKVKRGEPIPAFPLPDLKSLVQKIANSKAAILTPLRKGLYGVDHLNQLLYMEHQKRGAKEIPIIITANAASQNLFNGDTGVLHLDTQKAHFPSGQILPEYMLPQYEYAYVLSVHKSQGSEYDDVMVLLPEGSERFGKEMLYTALTRAKKHMTILAHAGVMEKLVSIRAQRLSGITPLN